MRREVLVPFYEKMMERGQDEVRMVGAVKRYKLD